MQTLPRRPALSAQIRVKPASVCARLSGAPDQITGFYSSQDMQDPVLNSPVGTCHFPLRLTPAQELRTEDEEKGQSERLGELSNYHLAISRSSFIRHIIPAYTFGNFLP